MTTDERTHTRWPIPRRSATDRKLGGVAGGLARAWRIDPILLRVAFVVLALFGGAGVLLYCAGWLVMRGDGDDVSAIEALLGRGRSSVSPLLAIVLVVIGLGSVGAVFGGFRGWPFAPIVIGAIVVGVIAQHRRRHESGHGGPGRWADDVGARASRWGQDVGDRASQWGRDMGDRADAWLHDPQRGGAWFRGDGMGGASRTEGAGDADTVDAPVADTPASDATSDVSTEASDLVAGTAPDVGRGDGDAGEPFAAPRTPPAWDPLGAAPFAWDLPEPSPVAETAADRDPIVTSRRPAPGRGTARISLGIALIVGAVLAAGVASGTWHLAWATVAGITLAVIAVGLAASALQGRGGRILIGPGIFVAILTLALSVVGFSGTGGYGRQVWSVASAGEVAPSYRWNAGHVILDLSAVSVPAGQTIHTDVSIGGGQVTVLVPADATVRATCSTTVGRVECLGGFRSGIGATMTADHPGASGQGALDITVHSNAGEAMVTSND